MRKIFVCNIGDKTDWQIHSIHLTTRGISRCSRNHPTYRSRRCVGLRSIRSRGPKPGRAPEHDRFVRVCSETAGGPVIVAPRGTRQDSTRCAQPSGLSAGWGAVSYPALGRLTPNEFAAWFPSGLEPERILVASRQGQPPAWKSSCTRYHSGCTAVDHDNPTVLRSKGIFLSLLAQEKALFLRLFNRSAGYTRYPY